MLKFLPLQSRIYDDEDDFDNDGHDFDNDDNDDDDDEDDNDDDDDGDDDDDDNGDGDGDDDDDDDDDRFLFAPPHVHLQARGAGRSGGAGCGNYFSISAQRKAAVTAFSMPPAMSMSLPAPVIKVNALNCLARLLFFATLNVQMDGTQRARRTFGQAFRTAAPSSTASFISGICSGCSEAPV